MIYPYKGKFPDIHESVFMTDDVIIVGDVTIGEKANIWFGSVIRGDVNSITIGARTNIQDACLLHVTWEQYFLTVGADVTVGHGAILHGCAIQNGCLIGMGARILDGAVIGKESLVAAGAVVTQHFIVPEGSLVAGVPAKVIRSLSDAERASGKNSADHYQYYVSEYLRHQDLKNGKSNAHVLSEIKSKK